MSLQEYKVTGEPMTGEARDDMVRRAAEVKEEFAPGHGRFMANLMTAFDAGIAEMIEHDQKGNSAQGLRANRMTAIADVLGY